MKLLFSQTSSSPSPGDGGTDEQDPINPWLWLGPLLGFLGLLLLTGVGVAAFLIVRTKSRKKEGRYKPSAMERKQGTVFHCSQTTDCSVEIIIILYCSSPQAADASSAEPREADLRASWWICPLRVTALQTGKKELPRCSKVKEDMRSEGC